jgi:hypothetical protein
MPNPYSSIIEPIQESLHHLNILLVNLDTKYPNGLPVMIAQELQYDIFSTLSTLMATRENVDKQLVEYAKTILATRGYKFSAEPEL